ncbi:hypothetical protein FAZ95_33010 [Trinickia violacea]|uniref:Glycosyltransferase RgtA/B/C/D-like domain-containing protein n=1 Tax=Trinickia violacea TaxID=2571746 RepID=A0A4P8IZE5_9BURK|nr:hypothetical protein [Trinickia violacea]QCP53827.1 hypothetical protein FAZ95_33010 [Trinickia violacea]
MAAITVCIMCVTFKKSKTKQTHKRSQPHTPGGIQLEKFVAARGGKHSWGTPPFSIVAALIGYGIVLFAPPVLNDPDTYWHIAAGRWMLQHHAIPHADPFSYALNGAPWVAHEWLSEVLMALAYRAAGWSGIHILFGLATAATSGVLARYLARWLSQPAASVVFILGTACISGSLLARPHLLALAALTLWTSGLLTARDRGMAPSVLLLPLMVIWANLHASFVFGLGLVLPIAVDAVVEAKSGRGLIARRWGIFLGAAIGASILTPNGWHGLLFPFHLMRMATTSSIDEWEPTSFQTLQPLEGALVALLYVAFSRHVRLPIGRLIILLGLLHLALHHARHQMLAGIVGAMVLAMPLGQAFADAEREGTSRRSSPLWLFGAIACVALLSAIRLTHPVERTDGPASPIAALNHVPIEIQREHVFNSYAFGGYLIFRGIKPFIDGRADVYGDDFISTYLAAMTPNRAVFEGLVDKDGIRWTILPARSPAVAVIEALPQWQRIYADGIAVVDVRVADPRHHEESAE